MKNEIQKFNYEKKEVRTIIDEHEETWFVAKDVCDILELNNVSRAMERLDDDEKLTLPLVISGQKRDTWITNESGLYHLVLTSEKPEAKKFRKWVTSVVLPSIRKAGKYTTEQAHEKELDLQRITDEIEKVEIDIINLKSSIKDLNNTREQKLIELKQIIRSNSNQLKLELKN